MTVKQVNFTLDKYKLYINYKKYTEKRNILYLDQDSYQFYGFQYKPLIVPETVKT